MRVRGGGVGEEGVCGGGESVYVGGERVWLLGARVYVVREGVYVVRESMYTPQNNTQPDTKNTHLNQPTPLQKIPMPHKITPAVYLDHTWPPSKPQTHDGE